VLLTSGLEKTELILLSSLLSVLALRDLSILTLFNKYLSQAWWLTPVIPPPRNKRQVEQKGVSYVGGYIVRPYSEL
jgi:hypothetical protein